MADERVKQRFALRDARRPNENTKVGERKTSNHNATRYRPTEHSSRETTHDTRPSAWFYATGGK